MSVARLDLHVALYRPEIPPNTGNVIRLCANTGARLHLVKPLGFSMADRDLRRAGLDYREYADVAVHEDLAALRSVLAAPRLIAFSARAEAACHDFSFRDGDLLLFGPESSGLPAGVLATADTRLRLPMRPGVRSLNLSNAVAVAVYEAWRQLGFAGAAAAAPPERDGSGSA